MNYMDQRELKEILEIFSISSIPEERNYWLFQCNSEKNFKDFYENGYIALGNENYTLYDNIGLDLFMSNNFELILKEIKKIDKQSHCSEVVVYYLDIFI